MNNGRKTVSFNRDIREQNIAFIFLEKIRYRQTEFVTKLIINFINSHGIDINGDYDVLKKICSDYMNDVEYREAYNIDNTLRGIGENFESINRLLKKSQQDFEVVARSATLLENKAYAGDTSADYQNIDNMTDSQTLKNEIKNNTDPENVEAKIRNAPLHNITESVKEPFNQGFDDIGTDDDGDFSDMLESFSAMTEK